MTQTRTAVIVFSLGGPDRPESIAPFLKNFFMDPAIIRAPLPVRWMLSRWIAFTRSRGAARAAYGALGGRSPLLENTRAQAQALQQKLGENYRVFVCMRYWHPMAAAVVRDVAAYAPDEVILLGLYPQFSTTTTGSAFGDWAREAGKIGLSAPTKKICCWSQESGFIAASARLVRAAVEACEKESGQRPRILFSAHGLPEKIIAAGDPYQAQCEATATAILGAMGGYEDAVLCYQSRVGPLRWIGPSTEEEIRCAGRDGVGVVVYPLAFVSEHVETLVELDIEYRHLAQQSGVPAYVRAPTVMTQPEFIEGLSRLVIQAQTDSRETCGPGSCGPSCSACPCSKKEAV
jgi:ferrochelatase